MLEIYLKGTIVRSNIVKKYYCNTIYMYTHNFLNMFTS